jgi:hypothetical protein
MMKDSKGVGCLTLSSMALVICDLAFFLMLTAQKSLKQKILKKIVFLEKCFLYIFCFRTSPPPPTIMPFLFILQKAQKIRISRSYWAMEILPPQGGKIGP